eukprot:gene26151-34763_t
MYQSLENAQMLKYIKLVDHVMNTVNSFTPGAKVYYNIEVPVPYIPILSCIEKNIMRNLDMITSASKVDMPEMKPYSKVITTQSHLNLLLSAACNNEDEYSAVEVESKEAKYSCADIKTFTFVLDPFQRFMKSVADFIWPHVHRKRDKIVNLTIAMNMFAEIFEIPFKEFGALFQYNVDIIGHIDNFEIDWQSKIVPQYNFTAGIYRYTDGNKKRKPDPDYLSKRSSVNLTHGMGYARSRYDASALSPAPRLCSCGVPLDSRRLHLPADVSPT